MNPSTIVLVQRSWHCVQPNASRAAAIFYARLFALDPTLESLFRGDMAVQGEKLMRMIGTAVSRLDDQLVLVPVLQSLGQRHGGYGVTPSHYAVVGAALLGTLHEALGEAFDARTRTAWEEVYGLVADTMIAGAAAAAAAAASHSAPAALPA